METKANYGGINIPLRLIAVIAATLGIASVWAISKMAETERETVVEIIPADGKCRTVYDLDKAREAFEEKFKDRMIKKIEINTGPDNCLEKLATIVHIPFVPLPKLDNPMRQGDNQPAPDLAVY